MIRQGRLPVAGIFLDESLGIPDHVVEKDRGPAELTLEQIFGAVPDEPTAYLKSLGLQWFDSPLGDFTGTGQRIRILDSGADESHRSLGVAHHILIDTYGQEKEAKYSTDRGCHGTKTLESPVVRTVKGASLSLTGRREIRCSVAPDGKS